MIKIGSLHDAFSEFFKIGSKLSRRSITAAKIKEKEKKERQQKIKKPNSTKTYRSLSPF